MKQTNIDINSIYGFYGVQNYATVLGDIEHTKMGQLLIRKMWSKREREDRDNKIHMVAIAQ